MRSFPYESKSAPGRIQIHAEALARKPLGGSVDLLGITQQSPWSGPVVLLGTKVLVENLETGDKVEVKITDRGPYAVRKRRIRIIDLSRAAANSIGLVEQGVGPVRVTVTERPAKAQKISADEETYFEVQVGAFEDGEEAHSVLSQVQSRFEEAYIAPREGPAGEYYRVRIGPFKTKAHAQQIANALKRGGHYVFLDEVPASAVAKDDTPER